METVVIGCKLPAGLVLRLYKMEAAFEPLLGGGSRETKKAAYNTEAGQYVIKGNVRPAEGQPAKALVMHGAAVTLGVPKDFWEEWCKQNHDHDALKNHMIFAYPKQEHVSAEAKELRKVKNGAEPMLQRADPRVPMGKLKIEPHKADGDEA